MRELALAVLLSASLAAQNNQFGIMPINPVGLNGTCSNFTSRGTLGANAGDILLEVPASHYSGVCQDASGSGTSFNSFSYLTQDQNASTVEAYSMLIRAAAVPGPGPDCTAAGVLMRLSGLSTPGGAGTLAWFITNTLATPSTAVPLCDTWFMGAEVAAAPAWPGDGQSFHISTYFLTQGMTGSNPAPSAPNIAWDCSATGPVQPTPRSIRFYLNAPAAMLNMANNDPSLTGAGHCLSGAPAPFTNTDTGPGGMWPQCQGSGGLRNDGLKARVADIAAANGFFIVFIGSNLGCPGFPVGGLFDGALYLNPSALIQVAAGTLDAAGTVVADVLPPGFNCGPARNRVAHFQAFTLRSSLTFPGKVTNRAGVAYLP
jgi:hypothetical protein